MRKPFHQSPDHARAPQTRIPFSKLFGSRRRKGVEWAPSETLLGIIVGACVVILIIAVVVSIYNAIFGSTDDRLAKIQFQNINAKISNVLSDPADVAWDFTILQQPRAGYFVIGFDAGETAVTPTLPFPAPKNPTVKTIDRPATECGTALSSCLCLYDWDVIEQLYTTTGPMPAPPKPLLCKTYPQEVLFTSSTTLDNFVGWGAKSASSSIFGQLNSFDDLRLDGTAPYYAIFVVTHNKLDPPKYLYIEKSSAWKKDPADPTNSRKWSIIYVADYTDAVRSREDALQLCPEGDPASLCSYAHQGGLVNDPACPTTQGICSFSAGSCAEECAPRCLLSSAPNQRELITTPCACAGTPLNPLHQDVRVTGSCATDASGSEYYIAGRCPGTGNGDLYSFCTCRSDTDIHNDGQCFKQTANGKETWRYCDPNGHCSDWVEYAPTPTNGVVGPTLPPVTDCSQNSGACYSSSQNCPSGTLYAPTLSCSNSAQKCCTTI